MVSDPRQPRPEDRPRARARPAAATLAGLTELSAGPSPRSPTSAPNDYQPYVGRSAFAHKGGVHGAAVAKVERSYQHIDPTAVGNEGRLVVSELGGQGEHPDPGRAARPPARRRRRPDGALEQLIKQLESEGLAFEGAEASASSS